jgi:glycerol-3-phosphate cytidylyltransferase
MAAADDRRERIGFIAGCFDPFPHPGQIWAMQQAVEAGWCTQIVIALHVDPSLERPHKAHPIMSLEERELMLRALRWTKEIVVYRFESELVDILKRVAPDVRILGDDYRGRPFTGSELGIPVFYAQRRDDWSATNFRQRLAQGPQRN